jgi:hypothetical protein
MALLSVFDRGLVLLIRFPFEFVGALFSMSRPYCYSNKTITHNI